MKKLILLAAVVMIAGRAFGQKKGECVQVGAAMADTSTQESWRCDGKKWIPLNNQTLTWSNGTGLYVTTVAKQVNGHWQLEHGMTLDDLMEAMSQQSKYLADSCEADKHMIFEEWRKSLDRISAPLKKSVTTPKKSKPIKKKKTLVTHDKLTCTADCVVTN